MYEMKRAKRLSQALLHLVTALTSLFTDQRMSGLQFRAKYKHTSDNSPSWSDGRPSKELRLFTTVLSFYFASPLYLSTRFFSHDLPYRMTTGLSLREVSHTQVISQLLKQRFVIRTSFCSLQSYFRS